MWDPEGSSGDEEEIEMTMVPPSQMADTGYGSDNDGQQSKKQGTLEATLEAATRVESAQVAKPAPSPQRDFKRRRLNPMEEERAIKLAGWTTSYMSVSFSKTWITDDSFVVLCEVGAKDAKPLDFAGYTCVKLLQDALVKVELELPAGYDEAQGSLEETFDWTGDNNVAFVVQCKGSRTATSLEAVKFRVTSDDKLRAIISAQVPAEDQSLLDQTSENHVTDEENKMEDGEDLEDGSHTKTTNGPSTNGGTQTRQAANAPAVPQHPAATSRAAKDSPPSNLKEDRNGIFETGVRKPLATSAVSSLRNVQVHALRFASGFPQEIVEVESKTSDFDDLENTGSFKRNEGLAGEKSPQCEKTDGKEEQESACDDEDGDEPGEDAAFVPQAQVFDGFDSSSDSGDHESESGGDHASGIVNDVSCDGNDSGTKLNQGGDVGEKVEDGDNSSARSAETKTVTGTKTETETEVSVPGRAISETTVAKHGQASCVADLPRESQGGATSRPAPFTASLEDDTTAGSSLGADPEEAAPDCIPVSVVGPRSASTGTGNSSATKARSLSGNEVKDPGGTGATRALCVSIFGPEVIPDDPFPYVAWLHFDDEYEAIKTEEASQGRVFKMQKRGVTVPSGATVEIRVTQGSRGIDFIVEQDDLLWNGTRANAIVFVTCQSATLSKGSFCVLTMFIAGKRTCAIPVMMRAQASAKQVSQLSPTPVIRYPPCSPHIFLSYRRTHENLADRVRLYLQREYKYSVFLDVAPDCGIECGDFQNQLNENLDRTFTVIPLITGAPSAKRGPRVQMTSFECIKDAESRSQVDWVYKELQQAVRNYKDGKQMIIPAHYGIADVGHELSGLPDDISTLAGLHAIELSSTYFEASIASLHKGIQKALEKFDSA